MNTLSLMKTLLLPGTMLAALTFAFTPPAFAGGDPGGDCDPGRTVSCDGVHPDTGALLVSTDDIVRDADGCICSWDCNWDDGMTTRIQTSDADFETCGDGLLD